MMGKLRTQDDIVGRIHEVKDVDFFGWETSDLLEWLDFDHAKEFLNEGVTEEQWKEAVESDGIPAYTREAVLKKMESYMSFAWEKANNCRGLSAARSMTHYRAWIWLLGEEDWKKFESPDLLQYEYYGKDNLVRICEEYGWDHTQWDDGVRSNVEY